MSATSGCVHAATGPSQPAAHYGCSIGTRCESVGGRRQPGSRTLGPFPSPICEPADQEPSDLLIHGPAVLTVCRSNEARRP